MPGLNSQNIINIHEPEYWMQELQNRVGALDYKRPIFPLDCLELIELVGWRGFYLKLHYIYRFVNHQNSLVAINQSYSTTLMRMMSEADSEWNG